MLLGILALVSGCKSDSNQELVERELRWQEDQIYAMQDQICEYEKRLDACRRENDSLRRSGGGVTEQPRSSGGAPSILGPGLSPGLSPGGSGRGRSPANEPDTSPSNLLPPTIQPGKPVPGGDDPLNRKSSSDGPRISPMSYEEPVMPGDQRVTKIVLNRFLTGGRNADGCYGDEGIMVVFEPRNEADEYVPVAGEVSIVVLDPAQPGEAGRVARWDYAADEVQAHLHKTRLAKGFQFDLRWPNHPPVDRDLSVYVRYLTADGRKLTADKDIRVELLDSPGSRDRTASRDNASDDPDTARVSQVSEESSPPAARTTRRGWSPTR